MSFKRRTRRHRRINISSPYHDSQNDLCDSSGPLFSLYSKTVAEGDLNRAERHSKDAEGIVLFTGLFSAALAALITVSIQDLRPGPRDSLPFSPPTYSIWVNSLWISSLIISITSALLATLIQQWSRRSLRLTEPLGYPHKQARMRQHVFNGVGNLHFLLVTDAVPTLLHLSVFLFFAGLLILLWHISHTVFNAVVGWVVLCAVIYAYITFLPLYKPDSPHFAPISSLAYQFYASVLHPLFVPPVKGRIFNLDVRIPFPRLIKRLEAKAEDIVWGKSPKLDADILDSLLVTLGEDGTRETFFEALPGFYESQVVHVKDVNKNLSPTFFTNFRRLVNQFLDQTLSSDSVSESIRSRRLLTCLKATQSVLGELAGTSITDKIIRRGNWNETPPSPEIGHILRRWVTTTCSLRALIGRCIIARIIATVEKHDDTWMALARCQLGVTDEVLRGYLDHGDSVFLANLIKTTRLFFEKGLQFEGILRSISGFNVKETLPELQRDLCKLWNEIVAVQKSKQCIDCTFILGEICHVHDALHPTARTPIAALPTSTTANYDNLLIGSTYALCPDTQTRPPIAPRQVAAVATSPSSSPRGILPHSPPPQRDETNTNPHLVLNTPSSLDPLSLPVEIRTHVPPALGYSYSTATSYSLATPRDVSVSDPGVIAVAGERDVQPVQDKVQDLTAHYPYQSDPPANDISMSTSRGKGVI